MRSHIKLLAIAAALAVVVSAAALAIAADPVGRKAGSDGQDSNAGDGCAWSDDEHECRDGGCGCGQSEPCPIPDVCDQPGTTLVASAAI